MKEDDICEVTPPRNLSLVNSDGLIRSSVSGVRWTLILSAVAIPLSYATNVILGRISPRALGAYGLLIVFSAIITTFFLFGGSQVVVRFLPELRSEKKGAFIFSYSGLVFGIAAGRCAGSLAVAQPIYDLFRYSDKFFLPRVFCYFDDCIGDDWELHSEFTRRAFGN